MNDVRTPTCLLSDLTERPVTTSSGASAGAVEDVVIRLREHRRPVVSGLLARTADGLATFGSATLALVSPARITLRRTAVGRLDAALADDEVLLRRELLGRWFAERATADLVCARDVELSLTDEGLALSGIYTRPARWFGVPRRCRPQDFLGWEALADLAGELRRPSACTPPAADRVRDRPSPADFAGLLDAVRAGARTDAAAASRALTHLRGPRRALAPWQTAGHGMA